MNEERLKILQMLQDGKINAEEADRLIEALEACYRAEAGAELRPIAESSPPAPKPAQGKQGDIFQRFTPPAIRVVQCAREESRRMHNPVVGTEHLLLGLIREQEGIGARVLMQLGVSLERAQNDIWQLPNQPPEPAAIGMASRTWSPRAKRVLELALEQARELNPKFGLPNYVNTEHILLGLIGDAESEAVLVLWHLGVTPEAIRLQTMKFLEQPPKGDE